MVGGSFEFLGRFLCHGLPHTPPFQHACQIWPRSAEGLDKFWAERRLRSPWGALLYPCQRERRYSLLHALTIFCTYRALFAIVGNPTMDIERRCTMVSLGWTYVGYLGIT
jgi:hypothetical protein